MSIVRGSQNIEPQRTGNKPTVKLNWEALVQDVEKYPDSYQYERAASFGVSRQGIAYALKQLKLSRKKTFQHPKANPEAQVIFQTQIKDYHQTHQPIVSVDKNGFAHEMPRQHGYSTVGQRCFWSTRLGSERTY